jgi:hypothetical protein
MPTANEPDVAAKAQIVPADPDITLVISSWFYGAYGAGLTSVYWFGFGISFAIAIKFGPNNVKKCVCKLKGLSWRICVLIWVFV